MNYEEAKAELSRRETDQERDPNLSFCLIHTKNPYFLTMSRENGDVLWYPAGLMACNPEYVKTFPIVTREELDSDDWEVHEYEDDFF